MNKDEQILILEKMLTARDATIKALEQPQWQPIETAPKDGAAIIGFCPDEMEEEQIVMVDYGYDNWGLFIDGQIVEPTHWMPLPTSPS